MREQKFRVWDKVDKRYYNNVDIEDIGRVLYLLNDYGHEYIIEQYTGLKDKNGKEIYEGDILQGKNNKIYEVSFSDGYTKFESNSGSYGGLLQGYIDEFEMRIIGNIHENPELLEDEE